MKIAQSKIALFFACILIWTLGMSLLNVISGNELSATKLGTIIFVGGHNRFRMCSWNPHSENNTVENSDVLRVPTALDVGDELW